MYRERAPLHWRRVEVSIVHVEVAGADGLGSEAVEQGNFGSTGDAHYAKG